VAHILFYDVCIGDTFYNQGVLCAMKYLLFASNTCKSCPAMKINLTKAGITYLEMNVSIEKNKMMAGTMHVRSLPTLIVTKGGKPIESLVGVRPVEELEKIKAKYK